MKKIKIDADVGQKVQVASYNGTPAYNYYKICDIEAYEIREEEENEETTKDKG